MKLNIIKKIKIFFTTNLMAKILAVAIAAILWIIVAASQSSTGKFPGQLPIKAINVQNGLVAIYNQKEVELEISAKSSVWHQLTEGSFSAYIDMSGMSVGTYELDVQVTSNVSDVKIVSKNPSKVFVRLEEVVHKNVVVNQRVEGSAGAGLVAGSVDFTPTEVEAVGPKSLVENLSEALAIIRLNGESSDFEKDITVRAFGDDGKEINDISFNPAKVKAHVAIIQGANNKSVGVKVNLVGNPTPGYYISKIVTSPNVVNITGDGNTIQSLNYLETQNIDVTDLSVNLEKNVWLKIPTGVVLQQGESNQIKVVLTVAANVISRTMSCEIVPINLNPSLRLASINPSGVTVQVSGASSQIQDLQSSQLILELNLSQKTVGSFEMPLTTGLVRPISGITILNVLPSSVQVTLSQK